MTTRPRIAFGIATVIGLAVCAACGPIPGWAASGLLHPSRRQLDPAVVEKYRKLLFQGDGVTLEGWKLPARGTPRGTIVYLHGVADNRGSSLGAARLTERGFDLLAYDSRAHGSSGGDACTYGYYEKRDLSRVLDLVERRPIVVIGSSLGAAVALQAAAEDDRITAVVAAESFSDLETVARERAPNFLTNGSIRKAFAIAEAQGKFVVADVSPVRAAARIHVPVLLLHGAVDRETSLSHSQRIFDALAGPKQLIVVPGAGHNQALQPSVWPRIEAWIDEIMVASSGARTPGSSNFRTSGPPAFRPHLAL